MNKKLSISALILVIGFLAVLYLPTIGWHTLPRPADPNPQEDVPFPDYKKDGIKRYPRTIEEWYNVFMPYHYTLSGMNYRICHLCGIQPVNIVVEGEDGWFFINICGASFVDYKIVREAPYYDYLGINLFSKKELVTIKNNLTRFRDNLQARNAKLIVIIAPNKAQIYGDRYYPVDMRRKDPDCMTRAKQVTALLKDAGITVIYPMEDLKKWEQNFKIPMYYKSDTHWNDVAGTLVARQILSMIDPIICSNMIPMTADSIQWRSRKGDLMKMIHYPDDWNERSPFFQLPSERYIFYRNQLKYYVFPKNTNYPNGKNVFLIGDSFSSFGLYDTLANYSKQLVRYPYFEINTTEIDKFKPDIVIVEIVERILDRFLLIKETSEERIPDKPDF